MLRELFIPISEALFWVTGGELLINTLWVLPWIGFWSLVMCLPVFYVVNIKQGRVSSKWPGIVFLAGFFPGLFMAVGPGIVQMSLIEECRWISAELIIEEVTETRDILQCRTKANFYDSEYSDWKQAKMQ